MPRLLQLDAAGFETHRTGLIALLLDAVAQGASVGFLADLDASQADAYFDEVRQNLDSGAQLIWIARQDDRLLGSVQLNLCRKPNGLNRAEVQKLLVLGSARRQGIGRQLMQTLESRARQLQRGLLYLDTEAGSPAERFYRALGYTCVGCLPDYACGPDGQHRPTALYYKTLSRRDTP